jgi:hypothetical protein
MWHASPAASISASRVALCCADTSHLRVALCCADTSHLLVAHAHVVICACATVLNKKSGLLGVSGHNDLRTIIDQKVRWLGSS